jgi:Zn-dependent peptidase ImmA (M78 family)
MPFPPGTRGSCGTDEGVAVTGINADDSRERQTFTLAHLLAHLLAGDLDQCKVLGGDDGTPGAEDRANAFAAHLLVPSAGLHAQVSAPLDIDEMERLAVWFGVEFATMIFRLGQERLFPHSLVRSIRRFERKAAYRAGQQ